MYCIYSTTVTGKDGDLLLDYSKNLINEDVLKLLFNLVGVFPEQHITLNSHVSAWFYNMNIVTCTCMIVRIAFSRKFYFRNCVLIC